MFLVFLFISISSLPLVFGYERLNSKATKLLASQYPPENFLDIQDLNGLLAPILKPRVPGSRGSEEVRQHFASFFGSLPSNGWTIEYDEFTEDTPIAKNVSFTNVIVTRDPPHTTPGNVGRVVLAAHYDSKYEPEGFIGAIDSAVPCALTMYTAQVLDEYLTQKWAVSSNNSSGVQIIFFDGEEAYKEWTDTDSLYGARHLADKMETEVKYSVDSSRRTDLQSIDVLILLDLLGHSTSSIHSYFRETDWMHKRMATIEERIRRLKLSKFGSEDSQKQTTFFPRPPIYSLGGQIGDDHLPFLQRGVPVLHLIPLPFPNIWHTLDDDGAHLDPATVHDWALIIALFMAEYFELGSVVGGSSVKEYL
ncbi:hypothetical protein AWJ20_3222 [Sugiyamaella lignohabitans]|uniref:Peptide hydrolase n=1 Tax=Sugiyamaella lignohabitans TaxID=796027 RepID=A0A167FR21_9ASCO|nr:uncharacterized protein AWJ20_3222 [Sugiyamaella lignohabitans]ANB15591.1 hypothetical protein AWJ20_3222 [Sugiyamaella lignohabitans]